MLYPKTSADIRNAFVNYFAKHQHTVVPSSPLIPNNDPSLMFVNSGMVQFKNLFTGIERRDYKRAVSVQKAIRAGGKHNDLENVGYTSRHHTFFEMLGNFSFGDYFKEQAIFYAWQLIIKEFGIPKDKIYVTIYHTDTEAMNYWRKIAELPEERIIKITTQDNFWTMGDTGPCGPCSEIFFDHGEQVFGGLPGTADENGDRYVEIWNMVFMQFEQLDTNTKIPLAQQSIDTGMGLERIAAVLQGVHDNYETDLFQPLITAVEDLTKVKAIGKQGIAHRVIADHLRAASFLIADGVLPANEGRGYVLRRIMRRSMRYIQHLGVKEPLLARLFPQLLNIMANTYPELQRAAGTITYTLQQEEEKFGQLLNRGLKLLNEESQSLNTGAMVSGEMAFKLYDTYGFPLDLTEDILKQQGLQLDKEGFNSHMEIQKSRAKLAWIGSGAKNEQKLWFELKEQYGPTEFLGYSLAEVEAKIISIIYDGQLINSGTSGQEIMLVTNQTPFYGESGGQKGDIGYIKGKDFNIKIKDTKKYSGIHVHIGEIVQGQVHVGDQALLTIDLTYRKNLLSNHSATHLLHAVLREVLGNHVSQKGSLVAADRLRFDFNHHSAITLEQLQQIERKVNTIVASNEPVKTTLTDPETALNSGALGLFGEKYDQQVRVVSINGVNNQGQAITHSAELCGGTHVAHTGAIGLFKIITESAIASGIRRIEAVTGSYAIDYIQRQEKLILEVLGIFKVGASDLTSKVLASIEKISNLEKQIFNLKFQQLLNTINQNFGSVTQVSNFAFLYHETIETDHKILQAAAAACIKEHPRLILVIASNPNNQQMSLIISIGKELQESISAVQLMKKVVEQVGGNGGGSKDIAYSSKIFAVDKIDISSAVTLILENWSIL